MVKPRLYEFCCYDNTFNPFLDVDDDDDIYIIIVDTNAVNFKDVRSKALKVTGKETTRWIRTYDMSDING